VTYLRSPATARVVVVAAALGLGCAGLFAVPPGASAHSPTDFLKVPVGKQATVLLPPMTRPPGPLEVTIGTPDTFVLAAASAGPGWRSRVTPHAAVLDGRSAAGTSLLVTVTGIAQRPGTLPLDVRVTSPAAPTESFQWPLTALAGYSQPVAASVGASRPDAPVAVTPRHPARMWPISLALALAALAVLVVHRRPHRRSAVT
jgi:hypothetical protein